jgi:phosphoribosylamine--glycine ligase
VKVLVIGSGGREHCLVEKISRSSLVKKVYCAPGNGGTASIAENIPIAASDIQGLCDFARDKSIDLTVVGPEAPLVDGIVDIFEQRGLKIFGPRKKGAFLEGSKVLAKRIMQKYRIPTADFKIFSDPQEAKAYVRAKAPLVVKADGLAAGKGVVVASTDQEADAAIDMIMVEKKFGSSGDSVVIEDCLRGQEASVLVFTDGKSILPLVSSQDHKAVYDGDKGPNTGGMGAYAPAPLITPAIQAKIINKICRPLIDGLRAEGNPYKGILYVGLMISGGEPYVLEFNVRFGDPETQAILPKLTSDLVEIILKTIEGQLDSVTLDWDDRFCLCVVLASGGYPGSYEKGKQIKGLEELAGQKDIFVFHAGTKEVTSHKSQVTSVVTSGGRVLNVAGLGRTIKEAQEKTYKAVEKIHFEGRHYRRDIGSKALKVKKTYI